MLRNVLLAVMAVALSYGWSAFGGYLLFIGSRDRSEAHLSKVVFFMISPVIFILIGSLVGFLSNDRPVLTSIVGFAPLAILLLSGPNKPASASGWLNWLAPILAYVPWALPVSDQLAVSPQIIQAVGIVGGNIAATVSNRILAYVCRIDFKLLQRRPVNLTPYFTPCFRLISCANSVTKFSSVPYPSCPTIP